jgi:hypothetical protein
MQKVIDTSAPMETVNSTKHVRKWYGKENILGNINDMNITDGIDTIIATNAVITATANAAAPNPANFRNISPEARAIYCNASLMTRMFGHMLLAFDPVQ